MIKTSIVSVAYIINPFTGNYSLISKNLSNMLDIMIIHNVWCNVDMVYDITLMKTGVALSRQVSSSLNSAAMETKGTILTLLRFWMFV